MTLGQYLKAQRIKSRITQVKLGKALGYTCSQYISNYERGLSDPPLNKAGQICNLLDVDKKKYKALLLRQYRAKVEKVLGE